MPSHTHSYLTKFFLFVLATTILLTGSVTNAYAQAGNLFISPQRLELNKKKKTSQLHLVNKSDEVKSYEIIVKNYAMDNKGTVSSNVEDMPFSSKEFIRFSPRRVTLKPGEDQYVRVMLRLPKGTADGGYHNHIEFNEIESAGKRKKGDAGDVNDAQVSFKVGAAYGVAIPIFITVGKTDSTLKLDGITPEITKGKNTGKVVVRLGREGNDSAQRKLNIHYVDSSGAEHLVITPTNVSVYREVDYINREFSLRLPEGQTFSSGKLRATLSEISNNKILDEETVSIQ